MPERPLAYFLTFGTYGSRLHGDARGSVDRHSNELMSPRLPRDDFRRNVETRSLKTSVFTIDPAARRIIEASFAETCGIRGWTMLALNVRTSHVHVVLAGLEAPEQGMHALKSNASRAVRQEGLVEQGASVWARHGSMRYLWNVEAVESAVRYTMERQGADLPGSDAARWRSVSELE